MNDAIDLSKNPALNIEKDPDYDPLQVAIDQMSPQELQLARAIGLRAAKILRDYTAMRGMTGQVEETSPIMIAADIAVTHVHCGLNLLALFRAPEPEFMEDVVMIVKTIDRASGRIPILVKLKHAQPRAFFQQ
jgi:hypothetical protein